jgi:hypothetical protein
VRTAASKNLNRGGRSRNKTAPRPNFCNNSAENLGTEQIDDLPGDHESTADALKPADPEELTATTAAKSRVASRPLE